MQILDIWWDVPNKTHRNSSGAAIADATLLPSIIYQQSLLVRIRLVTDGDLTPYTEFGDATLVYSSALDNDFDDATAPLVYVDSTAFNQAGDWEGGGTADPALGQFSFVMDANTTEFDTRIGTQASLSDTLLELLGREVSTSLVSAIRFPFISKNILYSGSTTPAPPTSDYYTKSEGDARYQIRDGDAVVGNLAEFTIAGTTIDSGISSSTVVGGVANVGGGSEVYKNTVANTANLRTITGGTGAVVTQSTDNVIVSADIDDTVISTTKLWSSDKISQIAASPEDYRDFTPQSTCPTHEEGRLFYCDVEKCHVSYDDQSDTATCLGQETIVRGTNLTGGDIPNGTVVYINGASGDNPTFAKAIANDFSSSRVIGVATHDIGNGLNGKVTKLGIVRDLNTTGYTAGQILYLDPTTIGALTSTRPTGGNFPIQVGIVTKVDAVDGRIYVDPVLVEFSEEINNVTGWGVIRPDDTTLSFVDGTRTFTITPTGSDFYFYEDGYQYRKTSAESIVIPNTYGMHYIYYDADTLSVLTNPSDSEVSHLIRSHTMVATVFWSTTSSSCILCGDERHSSVNYPTGVHAWAHFTVGAQYLSGLALDNFSISTGASNADAQFGVGEGRIIDEDYTHTNATVTSTTGLPVYYRTGASGTWERQINAGYSFLVGATPRMQYNEWTGATWQRTEITSGDFGLMHIFATNSYVAVNDVISIMGQAQYSTLALAQAAAPDEVNNLQLGELPSAEMVWIGTVIFETKTAFTNAVNTRVVQTAEGANYIDGRFSEVSGGGGGTGTATHNNLTGIQGGTVDEYYHLTNAEYTELQAFQTISSISSSNLALTNNLSVGGQYYSPTDTLSYGASIATDCNNGNIHQVTLTGNATLANPTNTVAGATHYWIVIQDGTGGYTLSLDTNFNLLGTLGLDTDADAVTVLHGVVSSDGTTVDIYNDLGGGATSETTAYTTTFTNSSLSSGILTVNHSLGQKVVNVVVSDGSDKVIIPDEITFTDTNNLSIDLASYGVIAGTWTVSVIKAGGTGSGGAAGVDITQVWALNA